MRKVLLVLPHCSTGGMPQYVVKLVDHFSTRYEILILEVSYSGADYVVQRNKLKSKVPFYSAYGLRDYVMDSIHDHQPDIVHFQELPETFVTRLDQIYRGGRPYNIVVTTHSSLTTAKDFRYIPDSIIAVNQWQKEQFEGKVGGAKVQLWEYPIEIKSVSASEKLLAKETLGMEASQKHILNIGLFTPGKNQGELFEVARKDPGNRYHFVGNMAGNFKDYWEPLLKNTPDNCVIWGEKADTDIFYKACDLFYFTSKFELNPLVVKEALGWGLPVKMYRLPSYGTEYDKNPLVKFL